MTTAPLTVKGASRLAARASRTRQDSPAAPCARIRTEAWPRTPAPSRALLLGEPLRSDRLGETLLPKRLALPVFCSDPLSSVAYATEQIVLVLGLGGLALLHLTPWVGRGGRRCCW